MPNLTDPAVVRDICTRYNFAMSKGFGQNFIINAGIPPRMAEACGVQPDWGVLEIGPGIGVLTKELALRARKVVALEVDNRLPPILNETLAEFDNVKIILEDALKCDIASLIAREFPDMKVAVCANLPYYITSPILMRLLEAQLPVENITVMVQKEAAQRITARPGTRDAGAISYAVAYYSHPELLFTIQPGSFYPAPKVTSAAIRLIVGKGEMTPVDDEKSYFSLIRAAFYQRRKTAANSISAGLNLPKAKVLQALRCAGLDEKARPEQLDLEAFARLQQALAGNI